MVAAGLQRHHGRTAASAIGGLAQGVHFGMGCASSLVESFAHQLPGSIEHHTAHHWIGAGAAAAEGGQLQRSLHPGAPAGAHASRQLGRLRHSPTT